MLKATSQQAANRDAHQRQLADLARQAAEIAAEAQVVDLTAQVAEVAPLRKMAAEADTLQKQVANLKAQVAEVAPLRKRLAVAESAAEGSAEKVKDLAKRLRKAEGDYGTCEADLRVWMRKHATMVEQKLEAEEQKLQAEAQRDRLFDSRLDMALVREAMPAVDAALRDLERQLQEGGNL